MADEKWWEAFPAAENVEQSGDKWWEAFPAADGSASPPAKPQGIASKIAEFGLDFGKRAAGAVVGGVASIPTGVQSGLRSAVRNAASADADVVMPAGVYQPGLDTDATVHGPETQLDSDKRLLQGELTAKAVRLPGADALAQAGKEKQQAINETASQATKDAVANTRITGNLLKGEIDFGKDPSLRGFVMQGADVFGSMLPVVATALVTRSPNAAGAVGGAMAAGEGAGNAKEYVAKMTDAQLQEHSPLYQRMVSAGATPAQAREIVSARAEDASALLQGAVATLGDRFTGSLVTGGLDKALTRVAGKSVLGRTAAGGALSSLEEGTQELSEGVASDIGTKAAVRNKEVGEDSAANFVLGAIGGGAPGAIRGAVARGDAPAGAATQELPQPAPTVADAAPVEAPPAPQAEAAGAAPVGVPVEAATAAPSAADPLARLAELEIINEQRDLTPDERQEAAALLSRLDDEQDASQGTQGASGALTNDGASTQTAPDQTAEDAASDGAAASGVPAAGGSPDVQAAGIEAAPVDADSRSVLPQVAGPAPTNFWSFAKSKGLTPGQIQVGSPEHQALKAEYDALRAGGSEPVLPSLQPPQDVNLQNRDRGRAASVVQMAEIARNPDYMRLGPSRTPDSGAPMVFAVGDDLGVIPTENFGREDMAVMSDGQRVPFRYAVVDATKVNPSNFADGRTNPDFSSGAPGVLKALNNGRTAGIRAAHEMGTAGEYVQGVQADAAMHGVSPDVVARTPNPMLVRIYADAENTAGMAAKSQGQGLGMSPAELARQDAPLLDASVLSAYQPGDVTSAANRDFVRAFVGRLNASGLDIAGMMTADGQLSQDGRKRIQAALMQAAYGDADLVEEMFDSTDTDIKAIGEALKTVAGQWANMRDSARLGVINPEVDITQNLLQAVGLIRKARRDGMSLYDLVNQPDLMTGEPPDALTVGALRMFYSGFYLTRALGKDRLAQNLNAFVRGAMATSADAGIFGEVVSPGDILAAIIPITEGQANAEAQSEESIREPVGSVDTGGGPGEGQSGIGRPWPEEGGAGPDQDRGSEPGQNAPVGAQQQTGPGGEGSQEGDAADEGRPERGQQGGIAGEAGAVTEAPAGDGQGDPAPLLESYTPEELAAREDAQAAAERQRASAAAEAESRAQADAERDGFALTGSDRPADVLEAQGQTPMFSFAGARAATESVADAQGKGLMFRRAGNPDTEAQRQFKETERAYGGREAYDRAKAAGKTKLTYGQWVQVRTPNFKAWFGDWEAARAQERLDSMKPMQVRVPDAWRGLGHAELRQKMAEELDRMVREKTQIEHPELGMIQVGRAGAKKTSGSARDPAKSLVAADIEALIPASIYARTEPSRGGDGPDIEGYSTLLARVDVDGVPLVASFTVRHQSDGQWYYNAVALHDGKEKAQDSYGRPDQQAGSRFAPIAGLSDFIRRPLARVNPEEVSKVVDSATGEPLVVYHGTNSDLSAFASDRANYFTADPGAASVYAEGFGAPREGANVSPVYLSIQRPKWMPLTDSAKLTAADLAAIKKEGFDGVFGWTLDTGMGGPTPIAREVGTGQRGMDKIVTEAIPLSPEQIKSATGNNGNFDARNPDIRYSFAGQQAATADQHALATAQQRLDAGEDAEAVRQDTGWFKGVDGKWRFEINDADAKLLKEPSDPGVYADIFDEAASRSNGVPLGKVLDHPALFAAYPALKATRFIVDDQYGGNGSYSADENAIRVRDPYSYKNGPDQLLSVLLHEIQHGIQDIEGFASGGSPNEFRDESADAEMLRDGAILAVMMRSQGTIEKAKALFVQRFKREPAFGSESAALSGESPESMRARADNALAPQERYRRLAGEVEARNTQARQGMTDEQRRATPPSQTADVADSRVIVMFNGKVAENAPMPANLRASRGRPGSMTESAVRQVASTIAARWAQSPPMVVVQSMQDMRVPEAARLEDARQRAGGASGSPRGFYYRGQVYLVADGLTSVRDAAETLFHEALGHHGLRAMFGNTLDGILDQIAIARPDLMKPKAEEYGKDLKVQKQRREVAEEVLAEMAQTKPELGYVKRAIAAIRTWLRQNVPGFKGLQLTDAEIIRSYILPARGWVERGARSAQPASAIAFSRSAMKSVTANYEVDPDRKTAERATANPTTSAASRTRDGEGAGSDDIMNPGAGDGNAMFSRSTLGNAPAPLPQNPTPLQKLKAKALQLTSPEAITSLIYEYQDKNIDLKRLRDHIKELGGTITDLNDAYLGEELYHKRVAKRTQDFLSEELKPLLADLRARGLDLPTLEQFLHARHAPEANKVLAERNPNAQMIDAGRKQAQQAVRALELQLQRAKAQGTATKAIEDALTEAREDASRWKGAQAFQGTEDERTSLSGMSDAAAKAFMDGLQPGQRVHLDALAAKVDAINAKTLDTLEKYGLMDKASMDAWRNTYQHYVPLHRDEAHPDAVSHPIGQGFSTKGAASKRRTGSNEKVTNILAHIAMQRESALTRGEKNRVAKKLYLMAAQNPDPEVWAVDKPPMTKTVDSETGFVRTNVDPTYKNKPNVVMVRISGKDQAIVFNERNPEAVRLAQSIKNQDVGDLGRVMRASARFTRFFAAMSTQYNPVFTVVNFVRDLQGGVINLSSTQIADRKRQVFMGIGPALRAIYADVRAERKGGTGPQNQWAQLWDEMQNEGGTTGYRDLFADPAERVKAIEKELAKIDRGDTARLVDWYVTGWVSDMNEAVENAVRLSAYKAARDSGMSKEQSASLAKNITVNFNRKGRLGAHANALYAFFNAAVQGNTRMLQTLSSPMGRKIILGGIALGVLNTMLMVSMLGGDGEDDEYKNLPEFVKSRNLMIPLGGKDYLTVPLPLGLHVLPNIGRLATEFAMGYHQDKGLGGVLGEVMTLVMDAFNPLGGSENVAMVIAPTPLDIPVGIAMNRDWQNRPIARENMSELDPEPAHKLTRDSATIFSKKASELLNAMGGGDEYTPGAKISQWTPDQIDYVVSQLTGGLGREMVKSLQTVNATMTGDELPDYKIPLWGRFKGSTEGPAGQSMQYSENVRKLNIVENSIKGRARDEAEGTLGSNKTAAEYMAGEPLSDLVGVGNAAERQIAKLRQYRASIQRRAEPGYQDEVKQINEQIAEVMTSLNREVNRVKKEAATN